MNKKVVSVFFSGTDYKIKEESEYLAANLYSKIESSEEQKVFGFDGCGVVFGRRGKIFGSGLDQQCSHIIKYIESLLKEGHDITLNVYGHSRGGAAALMLAKQLKDIESNLEINLALSDPVPGNTIVAAYLDPFKICLANKVKDLSDCKPLRNVLALYPHRVPSKLSYFYSPIIPIYPQSANVKIEEDVIFGCHSQAEKFEFNGLNAADDRKISSIWRFYEFMHRHDSKIRDYDVNKNESYKPASNTTSSLKTNYAETCNSKIKGIRDNKQQNRSIHSHDSKYITVNKKATFLNKCHNDLSTTDKKIKEDLVLTIKKSNNIFGIFKRFAHKYVKTANFLQLLMLGVIISLILLGTSNLGLLSFIALPAVIIGVGLCWHLALKPLILFSVNKFYYPYYKVLSFNQPSVELEEKTEKLDTFIQNEKSEGKIGLVCKI